MPLFIRCVLIFTLSLTCTVGRAVALDPELSTFSLQIDDGQRNSLTVSTVEIPSSLEPEFIDRLFSNVQEHGDADHLTIFLTDADQAIALRLTQLNPEIRKRIGSVRLEAQTGGAGTHGSVVPATRRSVAGYSLEQVNRAAHLISVATIGGSGVMFYFTSNAGLVPSFMTIGASTILTLLFNNQIIPDFQGIFSRYVNNAGVVTAAFLNKINSSEKDWAVRAKNESGRLLSILFPSLVVTSMFLLAANSGDFAKTFGSSDAIGRIFLQAAPGFWTNTTWDLFEADLRLKKGDESEKLARVSSYARSIFGAAIGPFFYLPHAQAATATIIALHGAVGFLAWWWKQPARRMAEKIMERIDMSENISALVAGYANARSTLMGSKQRFVTTFSRLLPSRRARQTLSCEQLILTDER